MLDIKKDDFRAAEMKKFTVIKVLLAVEVAYHLVKIILPIVTLLECDKCTQEECNLVVQNRIHWLLYSDLLDIFWLWVYVAYISVKLFIVMRKYSRLEYEKHVVMLSFNFLGLLFSLPLDFASKCFWLVDFSNYIDDRGFYYMYFIACVLPAAAYIFTRAEHDCFNCFNRIAPQRYSYFQFSNSDRMGKKALDDTLSDEPNISNYNRLSSM